MNCFKCGALLPDKFAGHEESLCFTCYLPESPSVAEIKDMPETIFPGTEFYPDSWILSERERRWLKARPEYIRADERVKGRLELIIYFCHRKRFTFKFVGDVVLISSLGDEWLFDFTANNLRLKHMNRKGGGCYHHQKSFTTIIDLLSYIHLHDIRVYRRRHNSVEQLIAKIDHSSLNDTCCLV